MAFTFANLAYNVYSDLGKIATYDEFVATGGSTTTIIDTKLASRPNVPSDDFYIDYTAIVVRDAAGAAAAPEGQIVRVTDFVSSTSTFTVDALTAAVASGDTIAVANKDIPLREMYRICNRAMTELGDVALPDTSLTSAASQTEYDLPVALKRDDLLLVEYQGRTGDANDNQWIQVTEFDVRPAAGGTVGSLILPQLVSGRTIRLYYKGVHPTLTAYNSTISETIQPQLAIAAATAHAIQWLNTSVEGDSDYWLRREAKAWNDLEVARVRYPITFIRKRAKWFNVEGVHLIDNFKIPS